MTTRPITFVTGNAGKFREASAVFPGLVQRALDLPELQELDPHAVVAAKLREARIQLPDGGIVVEDTSLYIAALGGLPGPLIKWFLERLHTEGLAELVLALGKGAEAEARCVVGYLAHDTDEPRYFEGAMHGMIVLPRGENGFGWDRLFQPDLSTRTLGEYSFEEKNAVSIRAQAFTHLREYVRT